MSEGGEEGASAVVLVDLGKLPGTLGVLFDWSMVGRGGTGALANLPDGARGCVLEWCLLMRRAADGNRNGTAHLNGLDYSASLGQPICKREGTSRRVCEFGRATV